MAKVQMMEGLLVGHDTYLIFTQEIWMCTQFTYKYASLKIFVDVKTKKKWDHSLKLFKNKSKLIISVNQIIHQNL